jgi:hypothetical protein
MIKKIAMVLALAFSVAATVGAMTPAQQQPLPGPPGGGGGGNLVLK